MRLSTLSTLLFLIFIYRIDRIECQSDTQPNNHVSLKNAPMGTNRRSGRGPLVFRYPSDYAVHRTGNDGEEGTLPPPHASQHFASDLLSALSSQIMASQNMSATEEQPQWSGGALQFESVARNSRKPLVNVRLENVTLQLENLKFSAPFLPPTPPPRARQQRGRMSWPMGQSSDKLEVIETPSPTETTPTTEATSEEVKSTKPSQKQKNTKAKAKGRGKGYMREFRSSSSFEEKTSNEDDNEEMTLDQLKTFIDGDILNMKETFFEGDDKKAKTSPQKRRNGSEAASSRGRGDPQPLSSNNFIYDEFLNELKASEPELPVASDAMGSASSPSFSMPTTSQIQNSNTVFDQFIRELQSHSTDPSPPLPVIKPNSGGLQSALQTGPPHHVTRSGDQIRSKRSPPDASKLSHEEDDAEDIAATYDLHEPALKGISADELRLAGMNPSNVGPRGLRDRLRSADRLEKATDAEIINEVGVDDDEDKYTKWTHRPKGSKYELYEKSKKKFEKYPKVHARYAPRYPPHDREKLYASGLVYIKDFRLQK